MDEDVEKSSYQRKVRLRLQAIEGVENARLYEQQLNYSNKSTSEESEYVEDNFESATNDEYDNLLSMDEDVEETSYQKRVGMDQSEYDQFTEDENVESSSQRKVRCKGEKADLKANRQLQGEEMENDIFYEQQFQHPYSENYENTIEESQFGRNEMQNVQYSKMEQSQYDEYEVDEFKKERKVGSKKKNEHYNNVTELSDNTENIFEKSEYSEHNFENKLEYAQEETSYQRKARRKLKKQEERMKMCRFQEMEEQQLSETGESQYYNMEQSQNNAIRTMQPSRYGHFDIEEEGEEGKEAPYNKTHKRKKKSKKKKNFEEGSESDTMKEGDQIQPKASTKRKKKSKKKKRKRKEDSSDCNYVTEESHNNEETRFAQSQYCDMGDGENNGMEESRIGEIFENSQCRKKSLCYEYNIERLCTDDENKKESQYHNMDQSEYGQEETSYERKVRRKLKKQEKKRMKIVEDATLYEKQQQQSQYNENVAQELLYGQYNMEPSRYGQFDIAEKGEKGKERHCHKKHKHKKKSKKNKKKKKNFEEGSEYNEDTMKEGEPTYLIHSKSSTERQKKSKKKKRKLKEDSSDCNYVAEESHNNEETSQFDEESQYCDMGTQHYENYENEESQIGEKFEDSQYNENMVMPQYYENYREELMYCKNNMREWQYNMNYMESSQSENHKNEVQLPNPDFEQDSDKTLENSPPQRKSRPHTKRKATAIEENPPKIPRTYIKRQTNTNSFTTISDKTAIWQCEKRETLAEKMARFNIHDEQRRRFLSLDDAPKTESTGHELSSVSDAPADNYNNSSSLSDDVPIDEDTTFEPGRVESVQQYLAPLPYERTAHLRCTHEKMRPSSEEIWEMFKDFEAGGKAVWPVTCRIEKATSTDDIEEATPKRLRRRKAETVPRISAEKQLQAAVLSISGDFEDWKVYVPDSSSDEEEKIPNSRDDQQAVEQSDEKSNEKAEEKTDEKLNEKSERKTDKKSDEKPKQTQDQTLNQIYDQAEQLKVETFYQSLGLSTALIYNSEYVQMLNMCATESGISDVSVRLKAKVRNKVKQELQDESKDGVKPVLREASMTPTPFEELPKMLRTECSVNFERLDTYTRIDLDHHIDLCSLTDKKLPEQVEYDKYIHVVRLWIKDNKNAWFWENGACFIPNANERLVDQILEFGKFLGCKTKPRIRHSHIGRVLRFPWPIDVDKFCKYYGLSDPVLENDRKIGYYVHKNLEGVFAKVFASGLVEIYAMNPGESTEMLVLLDLLTNPRYADEE
ncbi:trichohyalin-like isoform X2 [Drosophila sulfurigaster albostrigata]|uniref:trichohyalin-like isoform X2 n=1 Tax=Drosophila sulfurigaster albostrigata TaxID=89887 RepID=UPI002D21EE3C|nr:trichohyalin-like isoform X2 [Drosophila sulfurigaster albostrigata]